MLRFKGIDMPKTQARALESYMVDSEWFEMMQAMDEILFEYGELGPEWVTNEESLADFVVNGKITLYRGVPKMANYSRVLGSSWTVSKHVAKWHALQVTNGGGGHIHSLTFDIEDLLPHLLYADCSGYEAEVLINRDELFPYASDEFDDRWDDVVTEELEEWHGPIGSMQDWNYEEV